METVSLNGLILVIAVCVIAFLIGRLTSKGREKPFWVNINGTCSTAPGPNFTVVGKLN